ncbi:MAG: hypothetical protein DRP93_00195 [Candidatus Neomarinimicrobiota bacterium]|nr:MAG: hypothetical protein DRP93_00195 [Candidatus Neomarinimicrobiota bacterium]
MVKSTVYSNGDLEYYDEQSKLHNLEGKPAVVNKTGLKQWYEHGELINQTTNEEEWLNLGTWFLR